MTTPAPVPTPYLRLQEVTKMFGRFAALRSISVDIYAGEFVCFLGPSGCGKTTLLRAIAGLDRQTSGKIFQAGQEISLVPPEKRDFGIVFQSYALFPNLTVYKNVAYGLENRGLKRFDISRRVHDLLALVGLADQEAKYPAQLSGGEQQRVALARALAPSPGLLLLDEPLSALDAKVRSFLRSEIKALQRRLGITTIMVTHDQDEALSMADRVVVMERGRIAQVGSPMQVYHHPASAYVANFMGAMNLVRGRVSIPGQVCCGCHAFECDSAAAAVGEAVIVGIRPEDIRLVSDTNAGANVIPVRVVATDFLGASYCLSVADGSDDKMMWRVVVPARQAQCRHLDPGRLLCIQLPKEHLHLYPGTATDDEPGA